jgi:hypothetical protein
MFSLIFQRGNLLLEQQEETLPPIIIDILLLADSNIQCDIIPAAKMQRMVQVLLSLVRN